MTTIKLTPAEVAAIRRLGEPTAFMGLIDWPGTRYRGYRTGVYRRFEGAEAEVNKGSWRREPRRRVVHINVHGEVLEAPSLYERAIAQEHDR